MRIRYFLRVLDSNNDVFDIFHKDLKNNLFAEDVKRRNSLDQISNWRVEEF